MIDNLSELRSLSVGMKFKLISTAGQVSLMEITGKSTTAGFATEKEPSYEVTLIIAGKVKYKVPILFDMMCHMSPNLTVFKTEDKLEMYTVLTKNQLSQ